MSKLKKITFKQHIELSGKTMSAEIEQLGGTGRALLAVHALGLVDEAIEAFEWVGNASFGASEDVFDLNLVEELGDMLWYLARLHDITSNECGIQIPSITFPRNMSIKPDNPQEALVFIARILVECKNIGEVIKKYANHGHELNTQVFVTSSLAILNFTQILLNVHGRISVGQCAARNINKLKKRYPNGFDAKRSINR